MVLEVAYIQSRQGRRELDEKVGVNDAVHPVKSEV